MPTGSLTPSFHAFGADAPVGAVQFGASTAVLAAPQRLEEAPPLRSGLAGHDSNYEAGILTALGLLDPDAGGQLVLISDGAGAGPGLESAVQTAAARGVPISVIPAAATRGADLVVQAVEVPNIIHSATAVQARVRIASQRRTTARLRLWDGERLISDGPIVVASRYAHVRGGAGRTCPWVSPTAGRASRGRRPEAGQQRSRGVHTRDRARSSADDRRDVPGPGGIAGRRL